MSKLSERVRPDVEAAPWVVEEIKKLEAERDALAAQLQEMRMRCEKLLSRKRPDETRIVLEIDCLNLEELFATPDTSAQILARRDAAIWMEATEACDRQALYFDKAMMSSTSHGAAKCRDALRAKADELLNGLEKEQ